MKVYIVMEIGWEYNDENYSRAEDQGGLPKVAYESKEDARVACAKMNAEKLEQPRNRELVVEWNSDDDVQYITEFYEVKAVELINV